MTAKRRNTTDLKSSPVKGQKKGEGKVNITLRGELSINKSKEIMSFLLENLAKYKYFNLSIDNPEIIDLSIIQLIHSFRITAAEQQKEVYLKLNLSPELDSLLQNSGFDILVA